METVVWKNKVGAIIKYPRHFDVDLVEKRHGITGNIMIGLKYWTPFCVLMSRPSEGAGQETNL